MKHKIINADIFAALKSIPDNSIDIAVTSPPYWAQRNYGFDKQIGNEPTYIEFISRLVFLFNLLKRKLTDKGVFFLNIGDKYLKKYGKTPIGLIPYKLAHSMQKNGWILNDTIVWYKSNHMPSSVKNRFANSYEPVFAFSKNQNNYFKDFENENPNYSNILNVNLQPTSFNHIATYPEKLVSSLLDMTIIKKDFTVLDPFAGSGTTLKVIIDKNNSLFQKNKANGIMIEYNDDYVDLIKRRTGLTNIKIDKYPFEDYKYDLLKQNFTINLEDFSKFKNVKTVNIAENRREFYSYLQTITTKKFINSFPKNELLFIGLKNFSLEDIFNISLINQKGWIIRNMLVVKNENKWFPIFMIVHDNKKQRYFFNYKQLKLNHRTTEKKRNSKNYIGYKVVNNMIEGKREGKIISVIKKYPDGLPRYVKVFWKNKTITKEFIINDEEELQNNIKFIKNDGYFIVNELQNFIPVNKQVEKIDDDFFDIKSNSQNGNYTGKFKDIERKNWGASPGARSSVEEEYFSLQRLYSVKQNIVADYLNYIREKNNLSKKAFTELFPKEYKHTVGHWLRKDFGGSIPILKDWKKLMELFELDTNYTNYVCKSALKLQVVQNTKYKIPDDLISFFMVNKLSKLNCKERTNIL
ncbi:MAG: site-specific DNA-methyltransferase [Candidatus Cloacimonadota bacterium]|nr:site-specific DNA-methyltransferase [Candidatus Cloacimonadota bacterium]